jgi:acetate kinase
VPDAILVLNAGSSSIKFSVYALDRAALSLDSKGQVEGIDTKPHFVAEDAAGASLRDETFEIAGADGSACIFSCQPRPAGRGWRRTGARGPLGRSSP